jgi:dihydroxyacetone kinase
MTHVFNTERGFKDEFLEGLTSAYGRYLRRVPGASGVMSVAAPVEGRVSVVIGGGSGHYPAFAGLVGPGLCHGAVVGDLFSSPSAEQAYRCIVALDGGAGVLLAFGNYSGDVMHFGLAAQRAQAAGIEVRTVLVTDDVASAPADQAARRRGIAGGFFVFRAAAAAADMGLPIAEVERVARLVNAATFSFGVAFAGCTFPGRAAPLFTVEPGRIDVGLGIHGERGIGSVPWVPADELADVLLAPLLRERPEGARRARVLLNGLGATKHEELFVLYRSLDRRFTAEGIEVVEPEVGEYVTSLDMAGCSLTLCWLDDAIAPWLDSSAAAPAYRTAARVQYTESRRTSTDLAASAASIVAAQTHDTITRDKEPTSLARTAAVAIAAMSARMALLEEELGRLDAIAGDGDHGAGMARGMAAAASAAAVSGPHIADVIEAAGAAFSDAAGGASGALWGAGLHAFGRELIAPGVDPDAGPELVPDVPTIKRALAATLDAIVRLGGAMPGDKTMVDALGPFVEAFASEGQTSVAATWTRAAVAAGRAAAATAGLPARVGRAAVHGDQSKGTPDPGAVSLAAALSAAGAVLERRCPATQARLRRTSRMEAVTLAPSESGGPGGADP